MKENNFEKKDSVKIYLQDYTNEIMAFYQLFQKNGIEAVRDQFKNGFRLKSFEDYLAIHEFELTEDQKNNEIFLIKSKQLDSIITRLNTLSESVTTEQFEVSVGKVEAIIYY